MIGQRIGKYRMVRLLGEGGMGQVFEAVHEEIGRRAAIKVLRPELCAQDDLAVRLFREAQAVNRICHPGLLSIFEFGRLPGGATYLMMEYLAGESLRARMARMGRMGPGGLCLVRQVASAMVAAHEATVIHRDLKPDNIMIVPDPEAPGGERAKVLDFGIAKFAGEPYQDGSAYPHTKTGAILGTPLYMAPEQCRGLPGVGGQADVYSLGIILYEVLTGRPPFVSEAIGAVMAMHLCDPVRPLREVDPTTPAGLSSLVHAMLAKEPADRPTMAQVATALREMEPAPNVPSVPGCGEQRVPPQGRPLWLLPASVVLGVAIPIAVLVPGRHVPGPVPILVHPRADHQSPTPPPPARAAAMSHWSVESEPLGADVIDRGTGQLLGRTPWHELRGREETRSVELRLPGYAPESVVLRRGDESQSVKLRKRKTSHGSEEAFNNEDIYLPRPKS